MDLFKKINLERNINAASHGLTAMLWFSAPLFLLFFILCLLEIKLPEFSIYAASASVVIFIVIFCARRGNRRSTAAALDEISGSKSRLESAVELDNSGHPLQAAQLDEAIGYFEKNKIPLRPGRLLLPAILLFMIWFTIFALQINYPDRDAIAAENGKTKTANQEKADSKADEKENAAAPDIAFTAPEAEMRSRPMDEIAYEGSASAAAGFGEILLNISVNAKHKITYKIEAENMNKQGKINLSGSFALDELEVAPFDLVTYHLEGYAANDKSKRFPVFSAPQFIEVRPFREDAFYQMMNMPGGAKLKDMLEALMKILKTQIALNKSAFAARSALGRVQGKALAQELNYIVAAQDDLHKEIQELIDTANPELIPANSFFAIKQAAEKMRLAHEQLRALSESLNREVNGLEDKAK